MDLKIMLHLKKKKKKKEVTTKGKVLSISGCTVQLLLLLEEPALGWGYMFDIT